MRGPRTKKWCCTGWVLAVTSLLVGQVLPIKIVGYAFAQGASATRIIIEGDAKRTRFLADLTAEAGFSASVQPDPYRVVVDLGSTALKLPRRMVAKKGGLIENVSLNAESGHSTITIATKGPVLIDKSYLVPAKGKAKPRLALEFIPATADVFATVYAKENSSPGLLENLQNLALQFVDSAGEPEAATSATEAGGKKTIVIDPGHGGIDPGAIGTRKTLEKDVVFAFARELEKALDNTGRYDVHLTRETDTFLSLKDRVAFARSRKADLFIALHADTVKEKYVQGATIYTVSEKASDAEAEALAQKENRADIISGVNLGAQNEEVADILIELAQRESKNSATLFSRTAAAKMKAVTAMTGKPIRSAGFVVLKAPDVPSVLVELGYLSNPEDEVKLASPVWQAQMALSLQQAIDTYFRPETAAAQP